MAEALKSPSVKCGAFLEIFRSRASTAHLVEFENEQGRVDLLTR